jgi:iron complex outermembrane receptor protein
LAGILAIACNYDGGVILILALSIHNKFRWERENMNKRQGFSRASITFVAFLALSAPTIAQQAGNSSAASSEGGSTAATLEEITVTATRREESVQNVPISIDALTQAQLSASGAVSIADVAAMVPGLQFDLAYPGISTYTTISIRGMNANIGASVIGVYLDDTPIMVRLPANGGAGAAFPVLFDMSEVEVDRGPQGTLFGSSSEGGAVRFITNQPSLTQFSGQSLGQFGWTQGGGLSYQAAAAVGGPLIDNELGFRVSFWESKDGGYIDRIEPYPPFGKVGNNTNTEDKQSMRAALAFQVSDDVRITPAIFYQTTRVNNSSQFTENLSDPSDGQFNDSRLFPETSEDRAISPTLKIEWHPSFADLTATTSYWHRHLDVIFDATGSVGTFGLVNYGNPLGPDFPSSPADLAPGLSPQYEKAFTQEVRLASKQDGFITWVTGVFYDHRDQSDVYALFSDLINPAGTPILYDYQLNADDQIALYANLDFHLTKQLTVSLGERVAKVTTKQINTAGGQLNAGVPDVTTTASETPSLPRAVVSYQVDPQNLLYFSAGRGFRVGGGNAALPLFCNVSVPPSYNPDSDWSFEVGAKDQLFGGKLQIDSSVFHVIWSQIQQEISVGTCGGLPYIANAGQAIVNGFDLALQALLTDRLRINLSAGYANAYFDETVFNSPGSPLVVSGDKVGYPPQVNPPWDIDATANYEFPLPDSAKLYLRAEDQYHSHNPGPFRTQLPTGPGYFAALAADPATNLVNLRLGYVRGKVDLSLYLNNAFNSAPLLGKFLWSSSSALVAYDTFRPRTVGLTANVGF